MVRWGRGPRLLEAADLPEGFMYPGELRELIGGPPLRHWEWLVDDRLRQASSKFWQHHPRHLVPVAVRRGTRFLVCLDASAPGPGGFDVVTLDALDAEAAPTQHLPDLTTWVASAQAEEAREHQDELDPADPEHRAGWEPVETGRCACVFHLDDVALETVPYGAAAPPGAAGPTVGDLVLGGGIAVEPDCPGPRLSLGRRPLGPFHWAVTLSESARLHLDADGRVSLEDWLMRNPGVGFVVWPEKGTLHLQAPQLCRDGVVTLVARGLLDDRVRAGRRRKGR